MTVLSEKEAQKVRDVTDAYYEAALAYFKEMVPLPPKSDKRAATKYIRHPYVIGMVMVACENCGYSDLPDKYSFHHDCPIGSTWEHPGDDHG
jgi:hypothetical protein